MNPLRYGKDQAYKFHVFFLNHGCSHRLLLSLSTQTFFFSIFFSFWSFSPFLASSQKLLILIQFSSIHWSRKFVHPSSQFPLHCSYIMITQLIDAFISYAQVAGDLVSHPFFCAQVDDDTKGEKSGFEMEKINLRSPSPPLFQPFFFLLLLVSFFWKTKPSKQLPSHVIHHRLLS